MSHKDMAGAALRLLCLPITLSLLSSCQRNPPPPPAVPDHRVEEFNATVKATKQHPSLQPGSNEAGPAIHVDPYPHSAGMAHHDEPTNQDEPHR
jgi:hypothetical protein